jgi:Lon protease-like protein
MIMPPKAGYPPVDYGTILEIRSVQMLAHGRSMVETWGSARFRILERGLLDGYMVGRIER